MEAKLRASPLLYRSEQKAESVNHPVFKNFNYLTKFNCAVQIYMLLKNICFLYKIVKYLENAQLGL